LGQGGVGDSPAQTPQANRLRHPVVADAKREQPFELAAQWFEASLALLGVVMEGLQNAQGCLPLDGAD